MGKWQYFPTFVDDHVEMFDKTRDGTPTATIYTHRQAGRASIKMRESISIPKID